SKLLPRFWLWRGEPCAAFLALRRPGKAAEPLAWLGCPPSAGPLGRSGGKRGLLSFPQPPLPVSFSDGMFFRSSSLAAFRDEPRPTRNRCFAGKLSHCPQPLCSAAARAGYVFQLLRFRPRRDPLFLLEPGFAGGRAGSEKPGGSGFFGARDFCSLLHMPFASDASRLLAVCRSSGSDIDLQLLPSFSGESNLDPVPSGAQPGAGLPSWLRPRRSGLDRVFVPATDFSRSRSLLRAILLAQQKRLPPASRCGSRRWSRPLPGDSAPGRPVSVSPAGKAAPGPEPRRRAAGQ